MSSIAVIGAGAWGTALAMQAARAGNSVTLWARDPERARAMHMTRDNPRLVGHRVPEAVRIVDVLPGVADAVLLAVPMQHLRGVLARMPAPFAPFVVCVKGVEAGTLRLPLEVVAEVCPGVAAAVLTGPNFAHEVAAGLPAAAVIAATDAALRDAVIALLATPAFRLYGNDDPVGAQVGGAAKNVIAIAAGAVIGAGLGERRTRGVDHARPGRVVAVGECVGRTLGNRHGIVRPGRSAADLHRAGEPQLHPWTGTWARRSAGRRAGGTQFGH